MSRLTLSAILLLDSSEWKYSGPNHNRKRPRISQLSEELRNPVGQDEDSVLTLEDLCLHLDHAKATKFTAVSQVLTEIALRQWTDFFRIPHNCMRLDSDDLRNIQRLLQSNLRMNRRLMPTLSGRQFQAELYTEVWQGFLERLQCTQDVLTLSQESWASGRVLTNIGDGGKVASIAKLDAQVEQSLNRVIYLGALLLPFSVVAGILSMGDDFTPGQEKFFIFWVIAIPLLLFTLGVILLDKFRQLAGREHVAEKAARRAKRAEKPQATQPHRTDSQERLAEQFAAASRREEIWDEKIGWLGALRMLVGIDPVEAKLSSL